MLSREPQKIDLKNWYYEERTGIVVIHEVYSADGVYQQTDSIKIPWSKLETSLKRKKKKP